MLVIPLLPAHDASLGRVDYHSISHQTHMEMMIDGFLYEETRSFRNKDGEFLDVCLWKDVKCNSAGEVVEVGWFGICTEGYIDLQWMLPTLESFSLYMNYLEGTVDWGRVPRPLPCFDLSNNYLTGSVDLTELPPMLVELHLIENKFSGSVELTSLPCTLETLNLGYTYFHE